MELHFTVLINVCIASQMDFEMNKWMGCCWYVVSSYDRIVMSVQDFTLLYLTQINSNINVTYQVDSSLLLCHVVDSYKCFTGAQCLLLYGPAGQAWPTLKMKALYFFEMLVTIYQSTWHNITTLLWETHHLHANISKCNVKKAFKLLPYCFHEKTFGITEFILHSEDND